MPFYHVYGLFMVFLGIIAESSIIVMKYFDPKIYLKTVQDYEIRYLNIIPSLAYFLATSKLVDEYELSHVKSILCAGAHLSKLIEEELSKSINSYKYGSCGTVSPYMSVKIMDLKTGKAMGPMEAGELWLHTGDIAYYNNNNVFYIVNRVKELIKCKGHQVVPVELEALLLTPPQIVDAGVIGLPDEKHGEILFALIVRQPNLKLTEMKVKKFIADKVAPYKKLDGGVKFVKEIPCNPTGKILQQIIRDQFQKFDSKL